MATRPFIVDIDFNKNQGLNFVFQNLALAPSTVGLPQGFIYWNTADKKPYVWTGSYWLDLGQLYVHPTFTSGSIPTTPMTGAVVPSGFEITNGHLTNVTTRTLTPANIGAATAAHTHAFGEIVGLPTNTILGNNTASTGPAKALTGNDLLAILSIGYGTLAILNTGTSTAQSTWTAKDISDFVNSKVTGYITAVNLTLGTRTNTVVPINNSAGTGVNIPAATTSLAGVMTGTDKSKLDGIATGANNYVHPTNNPGAHPFATATTSGLQVLSQMVVNTEGHVTTIGARNLTAADIASVMINNAVNNGTNTTWSSSKIYEEIQNVVAGAATGALLYKGNYNPVTNTPAITTDTNIKTGYTYVVSTSGTFAGQAVEAGDMIIAKIDNPGSTAANWQIVNKNIPAIVSATTTVEGIIYLATQAEAIAGTNNTKAITPATLKAVFDSKVKGYTATFGNGSDTSFTFTHNLGVQRVIAQVYKVSENREYEVDISTPTANTVVVNVNVAPANNEYEIRIFAVAV